MGDMDEATPLTSLDRARMRALRNGIYHTIRRTYYEAAERFLNFLVIVLGTATAADLGRLVFASDATSAIYLGVMTALVGTVQLVWGAGSRARDHAVLQGRFYSLVARCEAPDGDGETVARGVERELSQIYADETATMHAVNALAYNAAQNATGRPAKTHLLLRWYHRWFANVWAFSPDQFRPA